MKTLFLSVFSFIFLATPFLGNAQDTSEFEQFLIQTFEVNLSNLENGNNNAPFLRAFDESLVWVDAVIAIDGKVTEHKREKAELKKALIKVGSQQSLTINWDITDMNELIQRKNILFASFEANISLKAYGQEISKGKNIVQVIAKEIDNTYVITYISIMQVSDKLYIGPCYVNISKTNDGQYTTTTSFPNGTDYEFIEKNIQFSDGTGMQVVQIENVDQKYFWNTALNIVSRQNDGGQKIGSATEMNGVILVILKDQTAKKCTKMIKTSKTIK